MTLHQLFDLSTIEHRHLLVAYVLVAVTQITFLLATIRALRRHSPLSQPNPDSSFPGHERA